MGSEFIRSKGTGIAQILYLMGMRPLWNSRGVVYDVEIIPAAELGRPRIDVLVQTSGQFRDAAASRITLIDKAVQIVSTLGAEEFPNYVREGTEETEQALKASGISAKDARDFSTAASSGLPPTAATGLRSWEWSRKEIRGNNPVKSRIDTSATCPAFIEMASAGAPSCPVCSKLRCRAWKSSFIRDRQTPGDPCRLTMSMNSWEAYSGGAGKDRS